VEEPGTVLDIDLAMIWWSLGDKDKAFHYLFQCVEKRMGVVAILIDHPMFKGMADDTRYHLLKKKLNLAE
jgi:adenylate cyclase